MRWLVAGYGDVVIRHSTPALRALGADVLLWGRDPDRAATTAENLGVAARADFAGALCEVEAVYLATPVVSHVPLAEAAVAAGRPVLIEKPVAGALPVDTSRLSAPGPVVGCAYYRRLDPMLRALRADVRRRRPWTVTVDFAERFRPAAADPKFWRTRWEVSGGGVLADAGAHRIDLLCWFFGPPSTVTAVLSARWPGGAEADAAVDLAWADGSRARCRFRWDRPATDRARLVHGPAVHEIAELDGGVLTTASREARRFPVPGNRRTAMFADFEEAVRLGRPPVCPLGDGVLVDRVLRAATRSSDRGTPVAL